MKILIVCPHLSHKYGGPAIVVENLATNLAGIHNNSVDIVTTDADFNGKLKVKTNSWTKIDNFRVRYFNCFLHEDYIFSRKLLIWLWKNAKRYDFVQLHTVFSPLISLAAIILQIKKVPYSVTPHGILKSYTFKKRYLMKIVYFHIIEKRVLEKANFVQALTEYEQTFIRDLGTRANFVIVPNGVNEDNKPTEVCDKDIKKLSKKKYILSISQIIPFKNIDKLIMAFEKVVMEHPEFSLYIAGEKNNYQAELEKMVIEKQIPNVNFLGFLDGAEKKLIFQNASTFVLPSEQEGFSIAVLEALYFGVPAVISTGCNFPETGVKNAALIVEPTPQEIHKAIEKIITSPKLAETLRTNGQEMVKDKYRWKTVAEKLYRLYHQ